QLLKMLRVSSKIPSALSAEHLSGHLQHLRSALTLDDEQQSGDPDDDTISMRTRAKPLIDLLENAIENKEFVMWDYHR
ncbi:MAG: DUF1840 family protein, partial [Gammaproteobacteria bacterium]|nr:DUF1840 family protein [Gammaproteobacteria bacterium]